MQVDAVIYDLDDTLYRTTSLNRAPFNSFFEHLRSWALDYLSEEEFKNLVEGLWTLPIDQVLNRYSLPISKIQDSLEVLKSIDLRASDLRGINGLELIPDICTENYLVTSGFPELQHAKINALDIPHYFREILVDNPMSPVSGKELIFRQLYREWQYQAQHIMVVGDNPEAEIQAGSQMGFFIVQIFKEEVDRSALANWYVEDLKELRDLLVEHGLMSSSSRQ